MPHFFGAKLRHLRKISGLTQIELASRLALARQGHVSNLEMGRREPSVDLVVQTACLFGVSTDYLLSDAVPIDATRVLLEQMPGKVVLWNEHFRQVLRSLRRQAEIPQRELALEMGLTSHVYISQVESGHREPSLDLVLAIAAFFKVTTDYLLLGVNNQDAQE